LWIDDRYIWLFTPIDVAGIHAAAGNQFGSGDEWRYSIGVEMIGHFETVRPSGEMWENTKAVLGTLSQRLCIPPRDLIRFHRDYGKASDPGSAVTHEWVWSEVEAWLETAPPLGTECDPETFPPGSW
jgi:hypothetical protein